MKKAEQLDLTLRHQFALALASGFASRPGFEFTRAECADIFRAADRLVAARTHNYRAWKARPPGWFNLPKEEQAKLFANIENRLLEEPGARHG